MSPQLQHFSRCINQSLCEGDRFRVNDHSKHLKYFNVLLKILQTSDFVSLSFFAPVVFVRWWQNWTDSGFAERTRRLTRQDPIQQGLVGSTSLAKDGLQVH